MRARGFVITCVEVWADYWYSYLDALLGGVGLATEKLFVRLGDLVIAISERIKEGLISLGVPAERIRIVENGVEFQACTEYKAR